MNILNRKTANKEDQYPVKVLQFGEGNFLRGFVDWMIDILNEKTDFKGSVHVVQPIENGIVHLLDKQDGLYHLLLNGIQAGKPTQEKRLITCISGTTNPYKDYKGYLALAENPDLEFIVSNTTESGIQFNVDDDNADARSKSFPAKLTALLHRRFQHFNGDVDKGLTIIPCELIEYNGNQLKETVLQYCQFWHLSDEFTSWVKEANLFCNSLVDRIVPGFPKDDIDSIQEGLGFEDNLVVMAEPFHLWVIEAPESVQKAFPADKAGLHVKFVKDLSPYRTRKVRILNGSHTIMVAVAYLQGLKTVKSAVDNEVTGKFIRETIFDEILPTLNLPEDELKQFAEDVLERFQNPYIKHKLSAIALNSISKFKVRVLPSILEYRNVRGSLPVKLMDAMASLLVFYRGKWQDEIMPLNDASDVIDFFEKAWALESTRDTVQVILGNTRFWEIDLNEIPKFQEKLTEAVERLLATEKVNS